MKTFYRLILVSLLISPLGISQPLGAQTIGVSIPAATHGWTGGLNFHAEETKNRLEAANLTVMHEQKILVSEGMAVRARRRGYGPGPYVREEQR